MTATAVPAPERPATGGAGTRLGLVIGALMVALLLAALDSTIVATALPTIVGDLHGLDEYSWVVTAYLLTLTISTPLYGRLGDLYGRKRLFQAAIVIFLVGSALSGLSQNMGQLIAFRALQGLGGGGLIVGSQAIIGDIVSPRERGRYQGFFGAVFGFASVVGPLVGGLLTDHGTWRWVFYVNLPVGALALAGTVLALDDAGERVRHAIDYRGAALMAAGVTCLILVTTWGGQDFAWGSPTIVGLAVAGVVLLGMFVAAQRHAREPLIPLHLFRSSVFVICCAVSLVVGAALFGATTYLPQYQQVVRGHSATSSGLQLLPLMAGVVLASLISGQIISRTGRYKLFPILGTGLMALGLFLLSTLSVGTNSFVVGIYMLLLGLGIGSVMQVLVVVAQNAVKAKDLGTATSTATFFRTIGGSFGVALFGSIFNATFARYQASAGLPPLDGAPTELVQVPDATRGPYLSAYADALDDVFLVGVPLALVALVVTLFLREVPLRSSADAAGNLAGASESFGLAPIATAGVIEEVTIRVRAAWAALARLDELTSTRALSPDQVRRFRRLFEDRIDYLNQALSRVQNARGAGVPCERWALLVELLGVERGALRDQASSDAEMAQGAAGARQEADARIGAAHAALDRLDQVAGMGKALPDTVLFLRDLFENRIVHIEDCALRGFEGAGHLPPAGWDVVLEVLATERSELAGYRRVAEVSEATARRAERELDNEAVMVGA
ncbi:MAG: MDR family MFS transporter [Acidimicrobiales bacterium]